MFKSILIPIDLSEPKTAAKIVGNAVALARINNAELHVMSIFPEYGSAWVADFFSGDHQKDALHKMGIALANFVDETVPSDVNCRPHVVHGSIYEEIISAANKLGCDLIIMGAHRPELSDYLLGPNAARVVRHAKISVLVVRD